ncbi:hypothetical protein QYM36_011479 [Artemia franciscana]|uniref:SH3 domain-containing protein n=2 Tax=Artemia franciscana TaxID=6661 RepID=A0AA88KYZ4_ARTSF|nr:hypothetical protein QYM36_011479 [Artemia franciscana]
MYAEYDQLSTGDLESLTLKQQQLILNKEQILASREQRLKFVQEHERQRQMTLASEEDNVKLLKEKVDAQEAKLRKLRALRGHIEQQKTSHVSLESDLQSMRSLFNEKEKELSVAVSRVDELTRQLDFIRKGSSQNIPSEFQNSRSATALIELERLRNELAQRNKLNEQQKLHLLRQNELLAAKKNDLENMDKRIAELQDRLQRKRLLNQQISIQLQNNKKAHIVTPLQRQPPLSLLKNHSGINNRSDYSSGKTPTVVAVEPFHVEPPMKKDLKDFNKDQTDYSHDMDEITKPMLPPKPTLPPKPNLPPRQTRSMSPELMEKAQKMSQDSCFVMSDEQEMVVKRTNFRSKHKLDRRVSFDPLALLLDAALEGEVELVRRTALEVANPSAANDEGITALHNAICAGHMDIVSILVEIGCDVNAPDSDGWTPLHCAASCNNLQMVKLLVENGACIFYTTLSDFETAAQKCEEEEEGFDSCSEYLYSIQEKLGIMNDGTVYAVYDYNAQAPDELSFKNGYSITVLRKGDEQERDWWWSRLGDKEGYVPRNLLGLYPRQKYTGEKLE